MTTRVHLCSAQLQRRKAAELDCDSAAILKCLIGSGNCT